MTTTIEEHSSNFFTVTFNNTDDILTRVTDSGDEVDNWVEEILRIHRRRLSHLVVGIDTEWRPSFSRYQNPLALLQICVGRRCLIIQLLYIDFLPQSLHDFLADDRFTFVGVSVSGDVDRLADEMGLSVDGHVVDLRYLAAQRTGQRKMRQFGLAALAKEVLGVEMSKPRWVTISDWDRYTLTHNQIKYACVDAFVSFEVGRMLDADED